MTDQASMICAMDWDDSGTEESTKCHPNHDFAEVVPLNAWAPCPRGKRVGENLGLGTS